MQKQWMRWFMLLCIICSLMLTGYNLLTAPQVTPLPDVNTTGRVLQILKDNSIHLNSATAQELQEIPGIGEVLSQRIVDYRVEHGPFQSYDDLLNINGIGEARLIQIKRYTYL